jgi:hypothetical protein
MSEFVSAPASSPSADSAVETAAIVQFANSQAETEFAEGAQSDWAFAGQHGVSEGEALDTIGAEEPSLPPLVALATFVIAEAELFDPAENPLVAFEPAADSEETGSIMWSGEDLAAGEAPATIESSGETVIVLHDVIVHGISLDWTDPLYS